MSVRWMVGFTSETEGITIAAIGDSTVEAAAALTDQYGEGVLILLAHTQDELRDTARSVEEAQGSETPQILKAIQHVVTADDPGESVEPGGATGSRDSNDDADQGPVCTICGTSITADRATASRLTIGEERCSDCVV